MFNTVYGHSAIKAQLERQLREDTLVHAYLFCGAAGTGKTTLAREFLTEALRNGLQDKTRIITPAHPDFLCIGEKDETIKIESIRSLTAQTTVRPLEGSRRSILIAHADKMTAQAQNALLKTIEEPPAGNVFVLVTDHPDELLPTISSRCQKLVFHDLSQAEKKLLVRHAGASPALADLSLSPEDMLAHLADPELGKTEERYFERLMRIVNGNGQDLFSLAEDLSKDNSKMIIEVFIRKLGLRIKNTKDNARLLQTSDALFELLNKLQYNSNLRLQWEACLIQILTGAF